MKTKKPSQATEVNLNAKQLDIFQKIISFNWAGIAVDIKKTLNLMALTYIRSERIEGESEETRADIAYYLWMLQNLIDDLRDCELNWPNIDDKKMFFDDRITGFNALSDPETASNAKDALSELALDYIKSKEVIGEPKEDRDKISLHFHLLNNLVSDIYDLAIITEEIERINSGIEKNVKTQAFDYQCRNCLSKEEDIKNLKKKCAVKDLKIEELFIDLKASFIKKGTVEALEFLNAEQDKRIKDLIINGTSSKDCKVVTFPEPTKS